MGEKEWHKLFTLAGRGVQQQFQTSEFRVWKCDRTDSCQTKPHDSSLWFVNTQGQIPNYPGELSTIPYFSPRSSKSGRKQGAWMDVRGCLFSVFHTCARKYWCDCTDTKPVGFDTTPVCFSFFMPICSSWSWSLWMPEPQNTQSPGRLTYLGKDSKRVEKP